MKLDEMKIIVTGAASGLGWCFATELARAGAQVAACDVDSAGLAALSEQLRDRGTIHECDVTSEQSVSWMVAAAHKAMGGLNGLINNAGIFRDGMLVSQDRATGEIRTMPLEQWQRVIDVDLTGPFLCAREAAARMVQTETPGVIINISSSSRHGNRGQTNYSAAKAGLAADTRVWAEELAPHKIRVGAIAPGFVETPILKAMRAEVLDRMLAAVPLRRAAKPEEIWAAARFIIECDYFTGRCVDVDGGISS